MILKDKVTNEITEMFIKNIEQYTDNDEGKALVAARPAV